MQFWIAKGKDQAANGPYSLAQVQKMIDNNKWRAAWLVSQDGAPYLPFEEAFQKQLAARQQGEAKKQEERRWREEQSAEASLQQVEAVADRQRSREGGLERSGSSRSAVSDSQDDTVSRPSASSSQSSPPVSAQAPSLSANPFAASEASGESPGAKRGVVSQELVVRRQARLAFRAAVALSIVGRLFLIINVVIWSGAMLIYGGGMLLSLLASLWTESASASSAVAGTGLFLSLVWFCGWLISFLAAITIPLAMIAIGSFIATRTAAQADSAG